MNMSVKAARWAVSVIAVMTVAMLGYVILRTELLELSYDIQKQNKSLQQSREEVRVLRFEVSQKKALANLDTLSVRLASPVSLSVIAISSSTRQLGSTSAGRTERWSRPTRPLCGCSASSLPTRSPAPT
jgi:hypothetical protein